MARNANKACVRDRDMDYRELVPGIKTKRIPTCHELYELFVPVVVVFRAMFYFSLHNHLQRFHSESLSANDHATEAPRLSILAASLMPQLHAPTHNLGCQPDVLAAIPDSSSWLSTRWLGCHPGLIILAVNPMSWLPSRTHHLGCHPDVLAANLDSSSSLRSLQI